MGNIKLGDGEIISDRRVNGARIKLSFSDWWKIISVVIVFILGVGNIKFRVDNHSEVLAQQARELKDTSKLTNENTVNIMNIKTSVERIDRNVQRLLERK